MFLFDVNGTVVASSSGSGTTINGTYNVFVDDGQTELAMTFPASSPLYELIDDWYFLSMNGDLVRFGDSGDILQFRKLQNGDDGGIGDGGVGDGGNGDGGSGGDSGDVASIVAALTHSNGLKIDEFTEDGFNETSDFQSYVFLFDVNGTVVASSSGNGSGSGTTINGTYSVFVDDGQTELAMTFPASSPLYELTDDWYFLSMNGDLVRFGDSGDILQFRKN